MVEINVPHGERKAIKAIDPDRLQSLVDQCLRDGRTVALRELRLETCGAFVSAQLRRYERSLADYAAAKSAKKREQKAFDARRDGSNLVHAVYQLKQRVETEEQEDLLFHVDDLLMAPSLVSEHLSVRVAYQWRRAVEDDWHYGSITFDHTVTMRPDFGLRQTTREPSVAKQVQARRETLFREWEHLAGLALHAVKEYFRSGGAGDAIPKTFRAKLDAHSRVLNNHSANFWPEQPKGTGEISLR